MPARIPAAFAPAALVFAALTLSACAPSVPDLDEVDEIVDEAAQVAQDLVVDDSDDDSDAGRSGTEGLSQEAIDDGYTVVEMPGGWPSELPLPDGIPVGGIRSSESFYLLFDAASPDEQAKLNDWYRGAGWAVESELETDGVLIIVFTSPETTDYGPLRRVTVGGMADWPTGLQYNLEVQGS